MTPWLKNMARAKSRFKQFFGEQEVKEKSPGKATAKESIPPKTLTDEKICHVRKQHLEKNTFNGGNRQIGTATEDQSLVTLLFTNNAARKKDQDHRYDVK